jgi:hypothetical protein
VCLGANCFCYSSSCVWAPILPNGLALHLGSPLSNSPCLSLGHPTLARFFMHLGTHLAFSACILFGHPSCQLTLPCPWSPNLGQAISINLPSSQNWFYPSSDLSFCLVLPCAVVFVMYLRAFWRPSCLLNLCCVWVPLLPNHLSLLLVTQPWPCRIKKSTSMPKLVLIYHSSCLFA